MNWIGSHLKDKSDVIIHSKTIESLHAILVYIRINRYWINSPRISSKYEKRVKEFIQFTKRNKARSEDEVKFRCTCVNYLNGRKLNATEVKEHLICDGLLRSYRTWTWHNNWKMIN